MFRENTEHEQEMLFSPLKDLSGRVRKKLQNHWSTHFCEHVFIQIDETKFERLYHDGYSRPNKPVNELVSLEIIKHLLGMSDKELEHAYVFDFRVRNALGKETLGDNICEKTLTNFRRRLMEYEEETGHDLLHEVFEEHRTYFQGEFEIDASTQRMDSTFIEANNKSRRSCSSSGERGHTSKVFVLFIARLILRLNSLEGDLSTVNVKLV